MWVVRIHTDSAPSSTAATTKKPKRSVDRLRSSVSLIAEYDSSLRIVAASELKISSMPWPSVIDRPNVTSSGSIRPKTGDMPRRSAACTDTWLSRPRCTR